MPDQIYAVAVAKNIIDGYDRLINKVPVIIEKSGRWCVAKDIDPSNIGYDGVIVKADNLTIEGLGHHLSSLTIRINIGEITAHDRFKAIIGSMRLTGFNT